MEIKHAGEGEKLRVATYCRVSTGDQNLEVQQAELEAYAVRSGWEVVGRWSDVMSGSKAERPGLTAMLGVCRESRAVDAVIVVKLDRLGRSLLNVVNLIDELDGMGVATICTSQGIDTRSSNPCGRVTYQILAAVSEFERNLIRERTKAGLVAARAAGKTLGRVSTKMPRDEGERAVIVAQWVADGRKKGYRGLADMLGGVSASTALRVFEKLQATRPQPAIH